MIRRLIKLGALVGGLILVLEAVYAALRPVPDLAEHDPSGEFGDPGLPELRVAVLGDSVVTAPGVGHPDEIWVRIVSRRIGESHRVVLRSFAAGGATSHRVIARQLAEAVAFQPDLVFVAVGANDAIRGVPQRRFERRLEQIVAELSATGAVVVQSGIGDLGTIPRLVPPLRTMMTRRSLVFDRAHKRVAERHKTWVVEQRSDDRAVWLRDRSLWSEDLFHVSSAGHARWAETVWKTTEAALHGRV